MRGPNLAWPPLALSGVTAVEGALEGRDVERVDPLDPWGHCWMHTIIEPGRISVSIGVSALPPPEGAGIHYWLAAVGRLLAVLEWGVWRSRPDIPAPRLAAPAHDGPRGARVYTVEYTVTPSNAPWVALAYSQLKSVAGMTPLRPPAPREGSTRAGGLWSMFNALRSGRTGLRDVLEGVIAHTLLDTLASLDSGEHACLPGSLDAGLIIEATGVAKPTLYRWLNVLVETGILHRVTGRGRCTGFLPAVCNDFTASMLLSILGDSGEYGERLAPLALSMATGVRAGDWRAAYKTGGDGVPEQALEGRAARGALEAWRRCVGLELHSTKSLRVSRHLHLRGHYIIVARLASTWPGEDWETGTSRVGGRQGWSQ